MISSVYPDVLPMYFLFFNSHNEFSHMTPYSYSTLDSESGDEITIPFSFFISKVKSYPNYQFKDLLMYHVDLEADLDISKDWSQESEWTQFQDMDTDQMIQQYLKPIPFLNDISISPSLSLFHSLNSLFFVFKEKSKTSLPKLVFSDAVSSFENNLGDAPIVHKTRKRKSGI